MADSQLFQVDNTRKHLLLIEVNRYFAWDMLRQLLTFLRNCPGEDETYTFGQRGTFVELVRGDDGELHEKQGEKSKGEDTRPISPLPWRYENEAVFAGDGSKVAELWGSDDASAEADGALIVGVVNSAAETVAAGAQAEVQALQAALEAEQARHFKTKEALGRILMDMDKREE
jgi:hypothetical protein